MQQERDTSEVPQPCVSTTAADRSSAERALSMRRPSVRVGLRHWLSRHLIAGGQMAAPRSSRPLGSHDRGSVRTT